MVKVSVWCTAHNHEKYISTCLDSLLTQKANCSYEIIVHDDASEDNTASIIKSYEEKYPDKIKAIYQSQNQWSINPWRLMETMMAACTGDYIAFCEGDDYWTDPLKIEKELQILDAQPEVGLVYTSYTTVDTNGVPVLFEPQRGFLSRSFSGDIFWALLYGNFPQTVSVMIRKDALDIANMPPVYLDYNIFLMCTLRHNAVFLPESTCCYRINPDGLIQTGQFRQYDFFHISLKYFLLFLQADTKKKVPNRLRIYKWYFMKACQKENINKHSTEFHNLFESYPIIHTLSKFTISLKGLAKP